MHAVHPISALQSEHSPWTRDPEDGNLATFRKLGIGLGGNFARNLELVRRVQSMAEEKNCTPAQLALAWVLAQGDDIVPILGTKHRVYLEENLDALGVRLTNEELRSARDDGLVFRDVAPLRALH